MDITDEEFKQSHAIGPVLPCGRELCCGDILSAGKDLFVIGYNKKCAAYVLYLIIDRNVDKHKYQLFTEVYIEWFEYIGNIHHEQNLMRNLK